jgi:hypothetical protein
MIVNLEGVTSSTVLAFFELAFLSASVKSTSYVFFSVSLFFFCEASKASLHRETPQPVMYKFEETIARSVASLFAYDKDLQISSWYEPDVQ